VYVAYHDQEWGVPVRNDRRLFEFLVLEGAQAGLSWSTILNKRDGYKRAFRDFDPEVVSALGDDELEALRGDSRIVRNRLKIRSARTNARAFLSVRDEFGSFSQYLWRFVDGVPVVGGFREMEDVPVTTSLSDTVSTDLKNRGFTFVGSTIVYAYLQAVGVVNDHLTRCFRYEELCRPGR
jgi:DNA-3-methyladenine glycosylase I